MALVNRSALVVHSPASMFDLVNEVEAYPEFLPWCVSADVHARTGEMVRASLGISRGGVNKSFTTENFLTHGKSIKMALVDGPFSALDGEWTFEALGEDACKISLNLNFEFDSPLLAATFGKVFDQLASSMVDAFVLRANQVLGK